jgi:hypothetical protein
LKNCLEGAGGGEALKLSALPLPSCRTSRLTPNHRSKARSSTSAASATSSRPNHTGIHAFEEDRKRDAKLQVAGHRIVRVTRHRLAYEADDLEADLKRLLA